MLKHAPFATLLSLAAAFSASAQDDRADTRLANSIAAIVEDKIFTIEDVRRELQPYLPQIQADSGGNPMKFRQLLEEAENQIIQNMTDDVLIVKEFHKDKGQIPESYVETEIKELTINQFEGKRALFLDYLQSIGKSPEQHRATVREEIIVNYMRSRMRKSASVVSPVKIERFYLEHKESFYQKESVHLRLIRLAKMTDENADLLQQTADQIMKKLEQGFAFNELAEQHSQDPKAKRGGDWGWVERGSLVPELADAAFALKVGEYSQPLRVKDNIFILYSEDRKEEGYLPIEEVREVIEETLVSQMAREAEDRFLERLRRDGYVRRFN